jgi:aromatic ring-opening dioxygenase LigB subunit
MKGMVENMGIERKDIGIITAWLTPHPPVVVPEVGLGREKEIGNTFRAMEQAADYIVQSKAKTIIVISPHAPMSRNRILVSAGGLHKGGLSRFGARGVKLEFDGCKKLAEYIIEESNASEINAGLYGDGVFNGSGIYADGRGELDHGVVVPLYFIDKSIKKFGAAQPKLVVLSIAYLKNDDLYKFGGCISRAAQRTGESVALIASGDLSHKLTSDGPYGYDPAGPEFDKYLLDCIAGRDVAKLLDTSEIFLDNAAQCGFYSIIMLYGAICGAAENLRVEYEPQILSYEGTFGVGYAIIHFM